MNAPVKAPIGTNLSGYIQTFSGGKINPISPVPEDVNLDDIAAALSKMCRYAGHCSRFYSVAEHCVHIANLAPDELRLTALMHDASEAYLVDIPRPVKPFLPGYYELEDRLMRVIAYRLGFHWPLPAEVKYLDNSILSDEREQNMAPMENDEIWGDMLPALGVKLQFWTPAQAELEFHQAFHRYGGKA